MDRDKVIVIKIKWWRFWRKDWCGLNPFAWLELKSLKNMAHGDRVNVAGYHHPDDGRGGLFEFDLHYMEGDL